jgi:TRAP-type C4-dicarboxylate transport system substrate-binding protein
MTIDEAMAKATQQVTEIWLEKLAEFTERMRKAGATDAEVEDIEREQEQWRKAELARLRAWLDRDGNPLQ